LVSDVAQAVSETAVIPFLKIGFAGVFLNRPMRVNVVSSQAVFHRLYRLFAVSMKRAVLFIQAATAGHGKVLGGLKMIIALRCDWSG